MTTQSTTITTPSTLIEELAERTGLSWPKLTVVVVLVMLLSLVGAAYLDGVLARPFNADFWRIALGSPAIIAYALLLQPSYKRWRDGAIKAFRPLVPVNDDQFQRSLAGASLFNRRREWLAVAVGAGAWLVISQPWDRSGPAWTWSPVGQSLWLTLVGLLLTGLVYVFMGYFIYSGLSGTRLFAELHRGPLEINVFDLGALEPIARWSLGIALYFIGGITLSLISLPRFSIGIANVIGYIPATLAPVAVFFLNMQTVHSAMVEAKERELKMIRAKMVEASHALQSSAAKGEDKDAQAQLASIEAWEAHQKRVKALPEWPYTPDIKRNLVLSSLLPGAVGIAKSALPDLLSRFLPPEVLELLQQLLPFL
jgi:hypothetical protein